MAAVRWRLPEETEWQQGMLVTRPDYASRRVSRVKIPQMSKTFHTIKWRVTADPTILFEQAIRILFFSPCRTKAALNKLSVLRLDQRVFYRLEISF